MFYGVVPNAGKYTGKPSYWIYVPQPACFRQGVYDGRIVCRLAVAAEEAVLAALTAARFAPRGYCQCGICRL